MITLAILTHIVQKIAFRDWYFVIQSPGDHGFLLQYRWEANGEVQSGRKWYISPHATEGEVVQTALKAVLTALEHEAREAFTYEGSAIFAPHFRMDALVALAREKAHTQQRVPVQR
jgi:hypothetical protein